MRSNLFIEAIIDVLRDQRRKRAAVSSNDSSASISSISASTSALAFGTDTAIDAAVRARVVRACCYSSSVSS